MFAGFWPSWVGCVGVACLKYWLINILVVAHSWLTLILDLIVVESIAQKYHFCALNFVETLLLLLYLYIVICFFEGADGRPSIDIPCILVVVLDHILILLRTSLELVIVFVLGASRTTCHVEGTRLRIDLNNVDLCFNVVSVVCYLVIVASSHGRASSISPNLHLRAILRLANGADVIDEVLRDVILLLVVLDKRGAFVRLLLILVMMG